MDEDPIVAYSLLTCGIIILICVILGLVRLCCKSGTSGMTRVGYPVAISNRLFNDSEIGKELPCLHCQLIEMGEMACYQEFCPHCGRVPPSRRTREDVLLEQAEHHRKLIMIENQRRQQQQQMHQQQQNQQHPDKIEIMHEKQTKEQT